jgi:TonB family protein
MKHLLRLTLCAALTLGAACFSAAAAEDVSPVAKNGYTVNVAIRVDETGKIENVKLLETEDRSAGDILNKMALAMALKTNMPPRQKEGKPIKYTAHVPFHFPIEGDEGAASDLLPKPKVVYEGAVMPVYPVQFREQGVVGGAVLELIVDTQGNLKQLTTLRASHPEFEAAARDAVSKWKFIAAQKDGQPVQSRVRLAIVFETEETMADLRWRVAPRPNIGSFVVIRPSTPIVDEPAEETPAATPAPADAK